MKLASIETITEILPIEGADKIELARVQGWQSVIKKNEYKVGDQVIFVPIDTVLTPAPWNEFLWDKQDPSKPIRVKTVKLRGTISQGLIFPKTLISAQEIWDHMNDESEDVSIAGLLGITKYEKPIPAQLSGMVKGEFPSFLINKTDEDNLKSNISVLTEFLEAESVAATVKYDGTSATYIKEKDGTFRVCSRNLELKMTPENVHWKMALKYDLQEKMLPGTSIQGEICGPGIQSNPTGLRQLDLFVFNYKELDSPGYHFRIPTEIGLDIPEVPVHTIWTKEEFCKMDIDQLQEYVNKIKYDNGKPAEGLVFRGLSSCGKFIKVSYHLRKMLSVKIINQNYKD